MNPDNARRRVVYRRRWTRDRFCDLALRMRPLFTRLVGPGDEAETALADFIADMLVSHRWAAYRDDRQDKSHKQPVPPVAWMERCILNYVSDRKRKSGRRHEAKRRHTAHVVQAGLVFVRPTSDSVLASMVAVERIDRMTTELPEPLAEIVRAYRATGGDEAAVILRLGIDYRTLDRRLARIREVCRSWDLRAAN